MHLESSTDELTFYPFYEIPSLETDSLLLKGIWLSSASDNYRLAKTLTWIKDFGIFS